MSTQPFESIFQAAEKGTATDVKYFIENGADVNAKDKDDEGFRDNWTPLHYAARFNSNVEVLKYLISQGANINVKISGGWTPLNHAAFNSNVEVLKYFHSLGCDVK